MSSPRYLRENGLAIQALARANKTLQHSMISGAKRAFVMMLVRAAQDIIKGRVHLSPLQYRQLRPFEQLLKKFISQKSTLKSKKKILQTGGFLGVLLKPLLSMIPSVLGALTGPQR